MSAMCSLTRLKIISLSGSFRGTRMCFLEGPLVVMWSLGLAEGLLLELLISCISMIFLDGRDGKASWSLRSLAALVLIFASLAVWAKDLLGDLFK